MGKISVPSVFGATGPMWEGAWRGALTCSSQKRPSPQTLDPESLRQKVGEDRAAQQTAIHPPASSLISADTPSLPPLLRPKPTDQM